MLSPKKNHDTPALTNVRLSIPGLEAKNLSAIYQNLPSSRGKFNKISSTSVQILTMAALNTDMLYV